MTFRTLDTLKQLDKPKACAKLTQWYNETGNFRQYVKQETNSLVPTIMAIELLKKCPKKDSMELIANLREKLLAKITKLTSESRAIIASKDSFKLTAFILNDIINEDLGVSNKGERRD